MKLWYEKGIRITKKGRAKLAALKDSDVKKILVIRHAAFGDMMQTRPVLVECKKRFPQATITLSLTSHYKRGAPEDLVDNTIITPGRGVKSSIYKDISIYRQMGEFDLLFDMASSSRSVIQSFVTHAKIKMGFPYRNLNWIYDVSFYRSDFRFETENLLDFLLLFGHRPSYPLDYGTIAPRLNQRQDTICYYPSSTMKQRNYPDSSFIELISKLAVKFPKFQHLIIQGIAEHEKFTHFKDALMEHDNVLLQAAQDPQSLADILSQTKLLISNDTGVRHLALTYHTPTVCFFSHSIPYRNYNPHDKKQKILLKNDGSFYSSEQAFEEINKHITSLYSK